MFRWLKSGVRSSPVRSGTGVESVPESHGNAGEYQLLYKYLRDRYANRVVLSFTEIEDLLGFTLPASARVKEEWWASADTVARRSAQADSWALASRTAAVNMMAQNVVFDRQTLPEPSRKKHPAKS